MIGITVAEAAAGLKALQVFPYSDISKVLADHFDSLAADAALSEDVVSVLGDFGLPDAQQIVLGIKLLVWLAGSVQAQPGGGLLGAIEDSFNGVVRPVPPMT
jgi:hypothetical protein